MATFEASEHQIRTRDTHRTVYREGSAYIVSLVHAEGSKEKWEARCGVTKERMSWILLPQGQPIETAIQRMLGK